MVPFIPAKAAVHRLALQGKTTEEIAVRLNLPRLLVIRWLALQALPPDRTIT